MIVMSQEVQTMFENCVISSITYITRYNTVTIKNTSSSLVVVVIGDVSRYYYTSLADASDMLYSLGVLVQRI